MTITYKDLKKRMSEVIEDNQKRENFIEAAIGKLIEAYKKELRLPDSKWTNAYGTVSDYVMVGKLNDGDLIKQSINEMIINGKEAYFSIGTVVDDSKFGGEIALCEVNVETDAKCERVTITVRGNPSTTFDINVASNSDYDNHNLKLAAQEIAKATFTDIAKFNSYKTE